MDQYPKSQARRLQFRSTGPTDATTIDVLYKLEALVSTEYIQYKLHLLEKISGKLSTPEALYVGHILSNSSAFNKEGFVASQGIILEGSIS
jgi:hypothetical protein